MGVTDLTHLPLVHPVLQTVYFVHIRWYTAIGASSWNDLKHVTRPLTLLFLLPEDAFRLSALKTKDLFRQGRLNPWQFTVRESVSLYSHNLFQRIAKHTRPEDLKLNDIKFKMNEINQR